MRTLALILLVALSGARAFAREVPITILHTTDVHGHLLPSTDYDGNENVGGMLRCATLIEQLRKEIPNLLLVDCGDTIQGAAESFRSAGTLTIRAFEWLRYDAWVLGNHEFDWGVDALKHVHDGTTLLMLGGNIGVRDGRANPLGKVRPFMIRNLDGVTVALVGLTTPGIPFWSRPELLGDMTFEDSVHALRRILPEVRAQRPDVMVLLLHQGFRPYGDDFANQVNRIAKRFPEFDAILGGHTHKVIKHATVKGIPYGQGGYHGNWLGKLDIRYDTVQRRVTNVVSDVLHIGDTYPMHEGMREAFHEELENTREYLGEKVGMAEEKMEASVRLPAQSPVQQLICRAIAEKVECDVVLHGILDDAPLSAGTIRRGDIWRVVPYENRIGVVHLTARELEEVLEENAEHANTIHWLGVYGLSYSLNPDAEPGRRVSALRLADGSKPHGRLRIRVAVNSYVLASGGQRFNRLRDIAERPRSRLDLTEVDTRTAVTEYVQKHSPLRIPSGRQVRLLSSDVK